VVGGRFLAAQVDASDPGAVADLLREHRATHVLNAVDPRFVLPVFEAARAAGVDYLDMAMSLSTPHPTAPYEQVGVKLGDAQFSQASDWEAEGRLALVGIGVEPGLSDVFARYAADHLFSAITELGVRDGANLVVHDEHGEPVFAPSFSIWTTIEECLNPPVVFDAARARAAGERDAGWHTVPPFHEPEVFDFPAPIGPVECVHVEHEEVLLMPRWVDAEKVTFKYGLGEEFIAVLPDPAGLGPRMSGATCAGLLVTGTGKDGAPREVYLHHVVDNAWSMAEYGAQCVVWQTAVNPVVALELIADGRWAGVGVLGPEAFDAVPFLDLLAAPEPAGYGSPWGMDEREP
jgi:saccharopine dehydrogenase-like NADP-dependent oxidoreductase